MTDQGSNGDWVITVLSRSNVERAFGPVVGLVKEQRLQVDRIELLSGIDLPGAQMEGRQDAGYSCAQVWAYGRTDDEARLWAEYRQLADELGMDIVVQRGADYRWAKRMFVFDMDSTLIQGEVIDELAKMAGVGDQVVAITAAAMRGEIVFAESFRRRVGLLQGLPEARVLELLGRIPLMEGAERLFQVLKRRGVKTAVLSGGFTFFGLDLQRRLGVDFIHANVLDVADGAVAGTVTSPIVDGARKAELLVEIAAREGIALDEVVAVGDGANDLPMLRLAGLGVAFHAKPVVRAEARAAMTHVGLDGLLYLIGVPDWAWVGFGG